MKILRKGGSRRPFCAHGDHRRDSSMALVKRSSAEVANTVDPTRSRMMASIRSAHTSPELFVRRGLFRRGFRYRLNTRALPGSPDVVLAKYRVVILVHGCFWHRHQGCRYFRLPKTRTAFWDQKLAGNASRDAKNVASLVAMGWRVAIVWECATRHAGEGAIEELVGFLESDSKLIEIKD